MSARSDGKDESYGLQPITPAGTMESRVFAQLRDAILDGSLPPGERLVLNRLAASMGVSRVPVTQALKRLEAQGFVQTNGRGDLLVAEPTIEGVWELYAMRERLLPLASREAAEKATPEDLEDITRLAEEAAVLSGHQRHVKDRELHMAIARAGRMPRLYIILENLWDHTEVYRAAIESWSEDPVKNAEDDAASTREHAQLLRALWGRDADAAEEIERQHTLRSVRRVLRVLEKAGKAPGEDFPPPLRLFRD